MAGGKTKNNFAHGTLGHAIEHGQIKGSHMTLNVQHESSLKFTLNNLILSKTNVQYEKFNLI